VAVNQSSVPAVWRAACTSDGVAVGWPTQPAVASSTWSAVHPGTPGPDEAGFVHAVDRGGLAEAAKAKRLAGEYRACCEPGRGERGWH